MPSWLWLIFLVSLVLVGLYIVLWLKEKREQKHRTTAYRERLGEEYDVEVNRLLEVQRLAPKDNFGPNAHIQALENVRLLQRKTAKNLPSGDNRLRHIVKVHTAFIMMWMASDNPEQREIADAIKDVCQEFGINAVRADDVEHQDLITVVVLDEIRTSEILIADLSGERPDVYYEVGFAHAIGKRPILTKRAGTTVHFDLAGYKVSPYTDITELRTILKKRLAAITGKEPLNGPAATSVDAVARGSV